MSIVANPDDVAELSSAFSPDAGFMAGRMSLTQLCKRWRCDPRTVRRAVVEGKLAAGRKVFGKLYFKVADVMAAERGLWGE